MDGCDGNDFREFAMDGNGQHRAGVDRPVMGWLRLTERRLSLLNWALIISANLALCALISVSPHHSIYDEQWFLDTVTLLKQRGLSIEFIREFPGAPGPTFTIVYAILMALFHPTFPWIRFFNVAFLITSAVLVWRILALRYADTDRTSSLGGLPSRPCASLALLAASLTALPTVGVSAGMVLTETPAVFFMTVSLLLLASAMTYESWRPLSVLGSVVSALGIGAAVIGRQNYLVILPCLLLAIRWPSGNPDGQDIFRITTITAVVVLLVSPIFIVWGGLIPPRSASVGFGISLPNGIRSAGYGGVIALLFAPEIYGALAKRKLLMVGIVTVSAMLALMMDKRTVPMSSVLELFSSDVLVSTVSTGFNVLLAFSAVSFLVCFSIFLWQQRMNWFTRLTGSTALVGILSNAKITHQFSSRYVFVFIPFLVLSMAPTVRSNWHQPLRLAAGACLSLGALSSYFLFAH
jgi:hypothetical protein